MICLIHAWRYLREISIRLPGSRKQKRRILSPVAASVRDYVTRYPNADYRTLTARFGEPQQIAETCVAEMEADELLRELDHRKEIAWIVFFTAVSIVTLWFGTVLYMICDNANSTNGYYVVEIVEGTTTIIEEGELE